jgi:phage repressor protein C with HTH and peptisase S24 domain
VSWAKIHIEKLQKGETVSFRPKGNSMKPKIESGDLVTVSPDLSALAADDIVLCKVKGNHYVHLVKAIKTEKEKKLYLIGNNKGGINGWVGLNNIYGKVTDVTA